MEIDENSVLSPCAESSLAIPPTVEPDVHERALGAILEVVRTNATPVSGYIRTREPLQGVQEWWAQMISGSSNDATVGTNCSVTGDAL